MIFSPLTTYQFTLKPMVARDSRAESSIGSPALESSKLPRLLSNQSMSHRPTTTRIGLTSRASERPRGCNVYIPKRCGALAVAPRILSVHAGCCCPRTAQGFWGRGTSVPSCCPHSLGKRPCLECDIWDRKTISFCLLDSMQICVKI